MKKFIIILAFIVVACSSDDNNVVPQGNNEPQEDTLIGTWELIEERIVGGETTVWVPVSEPFNFTYEFRADNTLIRSNYVCDGTYENDPTDYLLATFDCPEFSNPDIREYYLSFDNHNLILTEPGSCDESGACAYKFEKTIMN